MDLDKCGCDCGQVILPSDNDPFFKWPSCQDLWTVSMLQPEATRKAWRSSARLRWEMVMLEPWSKYSVPYDYNDAYLIDRANALIENYHRGARNFFTINDLEDVMRMLLYAKHVCSVNRYAVSFDMIPEWVRDAVRNRKFKTLRDVVDEVFNGSSASLLQQ